MHGIYLHHHTVSKEEIDLLGHAGNVHYLEWTLAAATAHSSAVGWDWPRYAQLGAAWVVRRHDLDYRRAAMLDDALTIHTWVSEIRPASSTRRTRIERGTERLFEATTTWAFIDLRRGVPTRIPAEVRDAFTVLEDGP